MRSSDQPAIPAVPPAPQPADPVPATASLGLVEPRWEPDGSLDWRRVGAAVLRFRWLILAVTLLGGLVGVAATRILSPVYVAQGTIWIDESGRGDARGAVRGPIGPGQLLEREAWVDLLRSFAVLDYVVRAERLYLTVRPADRAALAPFDVAEHYRPGEYELAIDPSARYTLADANGTALERGVVGDSVGARLGFLWVPTREAIGTGRTIRFAVASIRDGARRLDESLDIRGDPYGNFLHLELRGSEPVRIAAIVNALAQRYVEVAAQLKRERLAELTKILDQQLAAAQENLRQAETALERYGTQTITLPSDRAPGGADRVPALGNFFDAQFERDQLRRDHEAVLRIVAQARDSGLSASALEAIPAVEHDPDLTQALKELVTKQADLRAFKYRYTDTYPPVQRLTAEIARLERETIPSLARTLAGELASREAALARRLDTGSRELRQIPARALEEARLRRAATLAENVYTTLQQRYEEAKLAEASTIPDVRVLDSAIVPQRPVRNTAPRVIMMALLASFGLAVVGAVLLDRGDPRVRYPDQISRELGLPILGALPHLQRHREERDNKGRVFEDVAQLVEALRGIGLNLVYAYGAAGPMLVTVTSPGPGDGKSFLTANLARTFAEGGHRTLLLDADIRRGVLHRRLSARRRPGLTDCLRAEVPFDAIVQPTAYPLLSFIGCGTRVQNAPELLNSQSMAQLLQRARAAYDVVLLDSPPLGGGVDPFILGTHTGNLLLVLRTAHSHRDVAAAKLEVLRRLPIRLLGAVLNDVPLGVGYRYYASYSYYLPGYQAEDEHQAHRPLAS
ncbi:MAG TPA: GNVR domain-containing protein [Gemmatimonadales bacterium]|nr:GNVR domain-containing protein [Gemmatimonadales bacterium]